MFSLILETPDFSMLTLFWMTAVKGPHEIKSMMPIRQSLLAVENPLYFQFSTPIIMKKAAHSVPALQ